MADWPDESLQLRATLQAIAPGTSLRDGLERILRGRTGALIVLGSDRTVEGIATGGLDPRGPVTPTRRREVAEMDGAVIIRRGATPLLKAAARPMAHHPHPAAGPGTPH